MRCAYLAVYRCPEYVIKSRARGLDQQDRGGSALLSEDARDCARGCGEHDCERLLQGGFQGATDGVCGGGAEIVGGEFGGERWVSYRSTGVSPVSDGAVMS